MDVKTKICQICLVPAHGNEKYHQHYGALCCLSCKSFFRRCYRQEIAQHLFCDNGGKCDVTLHNRTKCKKCRYDRCLWAGLQENRVLSESECVKYSQKSQSSGHQDLPQALLISNDTPQLKNPKFDPNYLQGLVFCHYNFEVPDWNKYHTKYLLFALQFLNHKFRDFAFQDDDFKSLCDSDQNFLLMRNSKLVKAFYIARYFAGETGEDQLQNLLGDDMLLQGKYQST